MPAEKVSGGKSKPPSKKAQHEKLMEHTRATKAKGAYRAERAAGVPQKALAAGEGYKVPTRQEVRRVKGPPPRRGPKGVSLKGDQIKMTYRPPKRVETPKKKYPSGT